MDLWLKSNRKVPQSNLIALLKFKFGRIYFFQFPCHMPQKNLIFCQYCLSHWVTVTNRNLVCWSESLQQTKILFVALSHCDKMLPKSCQKCQQCLTFSHFWPQFGTCQDFYALFFIFWGYFCCFLELFGNIYLFCLLQWLSATNNNSVCCSGSVPQTKILFVAVTQCNKQ